MQMVRTVVKEELEKFGSRQVGPEYKIVDMTYKPLYKMMKFTSFSISRRLVFTIGSNVEEA